MLHVHGSGKIHLLAPDHGPRLERRPIVDGVGGGRIQKLRFERDASGGYLEFAHEKSLNGAETAGRRSRPLRLLHLNHRAFALFPRIETAGNVAGTR